MKKLLAVLSLAGSLAIGAVSANAETVKANPLNANAAEAPQVRIQVGRNRRWNNRQVRVVTQVRTVRVGRRVYRDTYRITYLPNGRTRSQLVSRVVLR